METKVTGNTVEQGGLNAAGLLDEYRSSLEALNRSPKTIEWYIAILRRYFDFLETSGLMKPVHELGREELKAFIKKRQNDKRWPHNPHIREENRGKLSSYSIHGDIRAIRAFWSWLHHEGYLENTPLAKMIMPKLPHPVIKTLTKDQIKVVINAVGKSSAPEMKYRCILLIMLDSGLRISEVVNIKMDDIDLIQRLIKVWGKGQKQRIVPISKSTKKELKKYMDHYRYKSYPEESDYLFPTVDGEKITVSSVQQYMRRMAKRIGLDGVKFSPHVLRHTFATQSIANGANVFTVKEMMGHESLQTTLKYTHIQPGDIKNQHNKFSPIENLMKEKC